MFRWLLLLRAINVGGNNIIPMKPLVEVLEGIGCQAVKSYIQSGNLVLSHPEKDSNVLRNLIAAKVQESFNCSPQILLLSQQQFERAVVHNPYSNEELKTVHFFFLSELANHPDLDELYGIKKPAESFQLLDQVFYLHAPEGIGRSKLVTKVEKHLGVSVTARNGNTIQKLKAMF